MRAQVDLTGKVVLVAGATGGVGSVASPLLREAGANLVLVARAHDRLEDLAASMGIPDSQCLLHAADLRDPEQARSLVIRTIECFGRIDVLLNLVGSWAPGKVTSTTDERWLDQLETNLFAPFYVIREAVPHMPDGGVIINAGNAEPVEGKGGQLAYAVAKGGVHTLTRSLALDLKPRGIRVNAIMPRNIDTPRNRALQPNADPTAWPKPEEVAQVLLFLASPAAAVVSGALIPVYGRS
ncbi:MAG: SDR family oxidoreductase [Thermoleophilia bacterium]|nr:SDR family oxidoreductase [Thermoleophilia bacterium]